jgi:flavin-dependent thymidylate synthase
MKQIEVELQEWLGSDRRIAEAAWTSSTTLQGKNKRTEEDVKRVVNMLADSKHSVPFESIIFRFWLKLPIAIDRQFMAHRIQSASGLSARYRTMPSEWLDIPNDVRLIMVQLVGLDSQDPYKGINHMIQYDELCKETNDKYNEIVNSLKKAEQMKLITNKELKRGREFFRGMLPQHNMTERVSIINLRSFSNFIKLRTKADAQPEIQYLANLMLNAVKKSNACPIALEALERNNWSI